MRNLKKVIALVAVFAMLATTAVFAQTFTDVASTDNYAEAIETLSALDILTGDDQNNDGKMEFRPNDSITRAEVAVIISRIQAINNAAQTATQFNDVPSSHWASGYIAQASGQGIVNGYGDGNFGPEDTVKYEEAIKMFMETLGYAPFVNDNGGYPTGYITAAQRYGVLDDVVGGGVGSEANRGMIAQMTYNAISTPLMDKYTYGKDAQYVIYENRDTYGYSTLLTRDLKITKLSGQMTDNSFTSLSGGANIDTSVEGTVRVVAENTNDNYNYGYTSGDSYDFNVGESDADQFLGYSVVLYAKEDNNSSDYTIRAITAASGKNNSVSFTLDKFDSYADGYLKYMKNDTDRTATRLNIQDDAAVIYNNIGLAKTVESVDRMEYMFGNNDDSGLVKQDSTWGGKVTVLDTDSTAGYDVVVVEIGTPAVVEELSANGNLTFKNDVVTAEKVTIPRLTFDDDDDNTIINVTKDGQPYDYNDLKAWDVLTIIYNGDAEYYDVKVLGDTAIDGSITEQFTSDTSAYESDNTGKNGKGFRINGTKYDVAEGAYTSGKLSPGAAGLFYIDEYGKIVAYDKDGGSTSGTTSDKYGYILNAGTETSAWDDAELRVQILDKNGEVYEAYLADSTKIENLAEYIDLSKIGLSSVPSNDTYKISDMNADQQKVIAGALVNQLVTYSASTQSEFKTITLATKKDTDNNTLSLKYDSGESYLTYDEDNMKFGKYLIDENTYVFYIKATGNGKVTLGGDLKASKDYCSVSTGASVAEDSYKVALFDEDDYTGCAAAIVLFDTDGGISPASNIAVINSVGEASVDGDDVYSVEFFMNGELQSATTKVDLQDEEQVRAAKKGDVFKFTVANGIITSARSYLQFKGDIRANDADTGYPEVLSFNSITDAAKDENTYFGAVVNYRSSNKSITLAPLVGKNDYEIDDNTNPTFRVSDANVYIYDPVRSTSNRIYSGAIAEVDADEDLVTAGNKVYADSKLTNLITDKTPALGMLDYAFVREYNNKVADVVIYKAYDFGRYYVQTPVKND